MNNIPRNTTNRIEFNFTCYALKLLGHNLYSNPWTAVSEIVANGIDAKAKNIYILVHCHLGVERNGICSDHSDK